MILSAMSHDTLVRRKTAALTWSRSQPSVTSLNHCTLAIRRHDVNFRLAAVADSGNPMTVANGTSHWANLSLVGRTSALSPKMAVGIDTRTLRILERRMSIDDQKTVASSPLGKLNFSLLISAGSAYSVAVGMAYLWGYWSPFSINILDYMGVADILTAAAWPLFGAFSTLLVGMLIGGRQPTAESLGKEDRLVRAIGWYWTNLRELHFLALLLIWLSDLPSKWWLLSLLGGTPLTVYVMRQQWIEHFPLPRNILLMIVFFIITAPVAAIATGQSQAQNVKEGRSYIAVYSDVGGYPVPANAEQGARLRLLGTRGETLFMWDPQTKRTVVAKFSDGHPLSLGRMNPTASGVGWDDFVRWSKKFFS